MTNAPNPDEELVELIKAPVPAIAEMLMSMLQANGIPAHVDGRLLQDEWAMAQKALGQAGVTVEVPASRLDEARAVLAEARRAGEAMEAGDDSEQS